LPQAHVVASDVSADALEVARRNARRHGVEDRGTFVQADGLSLPAEVLAAGVFDAIVSNPPYVGVDEMPTLARGVRDYEPGGAITDGGDGLSFYRLLAAGGAAMLKPGGDVFVEIADGQGAQVREVFASAGEWTHVGTWKDNVNAHDRVMRFKQGRPSAA
jgi:release factor glutamine methyltransferase